MRLLPLLSGETQIAVLCLQSSAWGNFQSIESVLDQMGFSPEDHCRRFRTIWLGSAGHPLVYAQQLKDATTRRLWPGAGEEWILEQSSAGAVR